MPYYKKVKKTKIKLNNVVILKREDIIVKTSTAINSSYYSYKSDEEEARKRCVVVKMAELLHLPRKLRELQQQQQSLSLKDFVSVVETLNMQERDPESSSSSSSPAASSAEIKKSKSKLKLKSPSFSKLIGKETNDKLRFMRKYWSMNHEKIMKRIVNGGACVYAVGSGEDEDGGWEEKNSDEEKEGYELCRRRILMGGRCKPLNVSGKLQYDETGILLPEDIST